MRRRSKTRSLVVLGALASGLLLAVTPAPRALAHASYKDSDPPDEGAVSSPPSSVWAEFTEPPAEGSYLRIYDPCGKRVDADDVQLVGYRMTVSISADKAGTYSAKWFVISKADSHPTSGDFVFDVTNGASCPGEGGGRGTSGNRSGGGGNADDPGTGQAAAPGSGGDAPVSDSAGGGGGDGNAGSVAVSTNESHHHHGTHGKGQGGENGDSAAAGGPLAQPETPRGARERGLFEGIPLGGLVMALALAALIGAAGGKVYAGIMGYRR